MFGRRVLNTITSLLILAVVISSVGRTFVQCADGSACATMRVAAPHRDCCHPDPCQIPTDKKCVVKSVAAVERITHKQAPVVQPLFFVQVVTPDAVTPARVSHRELEIIPARPPNQPSPKLGRAPRPPPIALV